MAQQRSVKHIPRGIRWLLCVMLLAQIAFRLSEPDPTAVAAQLGPPPLTNSLHLVALGEPIGLAVALTLHLQAFDTQPGIMIPFRELDYANLVGWLERIAMLDPVSTYPLLLASQVYSQVPDTLKQRTILDFVLRKFREDPVHRWRWLAHAAIVAKHRLGDPYLALDYARAIATEANDPSVPSWARQMHIFVLEDIGEREAAKILLGGLLESGIITDPQEARFLLGRLKALEADEISSQTSTP